MSLREATEAVAVDMGKGNAWTVEGKHPGRFYLFNHCGSICSQKTRITMREAGLAFTNVEVSLTNSSNYRPAYVSLRLRSWDGKSAMVGEGFGSWNGSSSTSENGFDPCVVPILVDLEARKVVSDSKVICLYITEVSSLLRPKDRVKDELVKKHIDLVDKTPHPALLYDSSPTFDPRPRFFVNITSKGGLHAGQINALERHLADEGKMWTDPNIKRAYQAKVQKTKDGLKQTIDTDGGNPDYFEGACRTTRATLRKLEEDLKKYPGDWLCGDQITCVDLFWGVSLVRLIWCGYGSWFADLPDVKAYTDRLSRRESILKESILNPHSGPSHHMSPFIEKHQGKVARLKYDLKVEMIGAITWKWTPTIAMGILAVTVGVACKQAGVINI
eukprot:CAMPEP_0201883636 /NCGR_PEP_ID=MMETSP0902-20130614/16149_1 /ASSEMBLY_ACC=CAM_ASM_000551 /TAXON_ID=420261 /ORGANISM="Thalassiosira antarctica, Strain CCMP982" /LENGTH=386 /DNA_ID=CAMNT_0048412481 /DNA_START=188 /DNA_END=1348 /DNA_ORIENTATION=-